MKNEYSPIGAVPQHSLKIAVLFCSKVTAQAVELPGGVGGEFPQYMPVLFTSVDMIGEERSF